MLTMTTVTLEELETHLTSENYRLRTKLAELNKQFNELYQRYRSVDKLTINEKGKEIVNPEYLKIPQEMQRVEQEIKTLRDTADLINNRLIDLENIEKMSKGEIRKSEHKINMSLSDMLLLNYQPKKEEVATESVES